MCIRDRSQGVRLTDDRSRQGRLRTASKLDLYASNSASNSYTYCASWERWPHSVTGQRRCAHLSAWKLRADAGHTEGLAPLSPVIVPPNCEASKLGRCLIEVLPGHADVA